MKTNSDSNSTSNSGWVGIEFRAVVEYAPSQKIPNSRKVRVDARQGQIDSGEYQRNEIKNLTTSWKVFGSNGVLLLFCWDGVLMSLVLPLLLFGDRRCRSGLFIVHEEFGRTYS